MCAQTVTDYPNEAIARPADRAPPASSLVRVLLVDDHDIVREGLISLLSRGGGMKVIGSAATGEEAVLAARRLKPDVVVMDLVLPDINGLDATRRILDELPQTRIIALSACHTSEHVHRALRAGASGYVTKAAAGEELLRAVKTVILGIQYISPGITPVFVEGPRGTSSSIGHLSDREREVLRLLVAGFPSTNIAHRLSLSSKTVDTYRHRIMVKLGVANRAALIRVALEYDLTSV